MHHDPGADPCLFFTQLDRRQHADLTSLQGVSPINTTIATNTPTSPTSISSASRSSSSFEPLQLHRSSAVSHRTPQAESPLATKNTGNLGTPSPNRLGSATSESHHSRGRHPVRLPPIDTRNDAESLSADLPATFPPPSSSASMAADRAPLRGYGSTTGEMVPPVTAHAKAAPGRSRASSQLSPTPQDGHSVLSLPAKDGHGHRKNGKKEQEQPVRESRGRTRRLSKPPPPDVQAAYRQSAPSPLSGTSELALPKKKTGKYPPQSRSSFTASQTEAYVSDSSRSRTRQRKERTESVTLSNLDLPLPGDINSPADTRRRRSSSLSSMFRASFDLRRFSVDRNPDAGFIGGIKLEQQQLDAHQRALDEQAIGPEADIHPALRQSNRKRSPSPFKFLTQRSESRDTQSRAYPPIAIRTSAQGQALLPPQAPAKRDSSMASKWRARMGLRPKSGAVNERPGQKLTKPPSIPREENSIRASWGKHPTAPAISSPTMVVRSRSPIDDEKVGLFASIDHGAHPVLAPPPQRTIGSKAQEVKFQKKQGDESHEHPGDQETSGSELSSEPSYETAPCSPPLTPPRRSSKRKSLACLESSGTPDFRSSIGSRGNGNDKDDPKASGHVAKSTLPAPPTVLVHQKPAADRRESSQSAPPTRNTASNPPSIPYDSLPTEDTRSQPRWSLMGAAKTAFRLSSSVYSAPSPGQSTNRTSSPSSRGGRDASVDRNSTSTPGIHPVSGASSKPARILGMYEWQPGPPTPQTPSGHFSDDTSSDSLQTPSDGDTPDTSPSQSEDGHSTRLGDSLRDDKEGLRHHSGYTSVLPSPAFSFVEEIYCARQPSPFDLDPIHAAALKVLEAFPDASPRRADTNLWNQSVPNLSLPSSERPTMDSKARSATPPVFEDPKPLRLPSQPKPAEIPSVEQMVKASRESCAPAAGDARDDDEAISKRFVECCSCGYYHDMLSSVCEALARPEGARATGVEEGGMGVPGSDLMTARCPWCDHEMNRACCAGLAAVVHVRERSH